ncbi:hypothetical protein [Acinetobacter junii]|uniref:hypothetical protein n=1 Tax=Acinetobacter junii TaxID=40215 RepID=UPI0021D2A10C|nr:hypothetical protein [Acinetobacter junii]
MKKTPKFQINDLILKKKSNHVFQIVKVFKIGNRTIKYRVLNLSTSSETAHLESQIERKATNTEVEANKRLPEEKNQPIEKIVLSSIGPYKDHWAIVYIELNSTYSLGGGRITLVCDDFAGSSFFGHVGQSSFKNFIAQCDEYYLIKKLFPKLLETVPVQSGEEFFEWFATNYLDDLKDARKSGDITKKQLRSAYDDISDKNFNGAAHLNDLLDGDSLQLLSNLLGDDWWWDKNPSLSNSHYVFLLDILKDVIAEFKKLDEVMV